MNTKFNIRSTVLAKRDAIPQPARQERSKALCAKLCRFIEKNRPRHTRLNVAVFSSMRSEVELDCFIEAAYARGWTLYFPCMIREEKAPSQAPSRLAFFPVAASERKRALEVFLATPLHNFSLQQLSLEGFFEAESAQLDVVVVPLVAFDDEGNRLGYGGGNYDRLLMQVPASTLVVGVAFEEQRIDRVPCEPHDQPLPHFITA